MVVWPGVVAYSPVDSLVGVSSALGAKLPYCPVVAVFGVEKGYEAIERIAVSALGVCLAWTGAVGCKSPVSRQRYEYKSCWGK